MAQHVNFREGNRVVRQSIKDFALSLNDLIVLTEAATGIYAYTPVICALAGAKKVYAIARNSKYGTINDIKKAIGTLAESNAITGDMIEIVTEKTPEIIAKADIITNSGNVRPINMDMIQYMKRTAVIPLMYETWEFREEDVDLPACRDKGILVMGTEESVKEIGMFEYSGPLCLKLINRQGLDFRNSKFVVSGNNIFAESIIKFLFQRGAIVSQINFDDSADEIKKRLSNATYLIVCNYPDTRSIVGKSGIISAKELKESSPHILVVQFFGSIDREDLDELKIPYVPYEDPGTGHMGLNIHVLGAEPVVKLNAGSLKVGEVMARARLAGKSIEEAEKAALKNAPGQTLFTYNDEDTHN